MNDYSLAESDSVEEIGRRAKRLRQLMGMTLEQVASKAGVDECEVEALENGNTTSLAATLDIHRILSSETVGETLFTHPRFSSIDEVVALEQRRLAGLGMAGDANASPFAEFYSGEWARPYPSININCDG
jgi:transcriptional regulator with XRE-family HTH domain